MSNEKKSEAWRKALLARPLILIFAAAGILLLLLGSSPLGQGAENAKDPALDTEAYRKTLEAELVALCEQVKGAGKVSLLLTLDGSEEAVYAKDERNGATDYVVSGGEGLLLYRRHPAVLGVAVVCTGGESAEVRTELTSLLSALLGVGTNRICITAARS